MEIGIRLSSGWASPKTMTVSFAEDAVPAPKCVRRRRRTRHARRVRSPEVFRQCATKNVAELLGARPRCPCALRSRIAQCDDRSRVLCVTCSCEYTVRLAELWQSKEAADRFRILSVVDDRQVAGRADRRCQISRSFAGNLFVHEASVAQRFLRTGGSPPSPDVCGRARAASRRVPCKTPAAATSSATLRVGCQTGGNRAW